MDQRQAIQQDPLQAHDVSFCFSQILLVYCHDLFSFQEKKICFSYIIYFLSFFLFFFLSGSKFQGNVSVLTREIRVAAWILSHMDFGRWNPSMTLLTPWPKRSAKQKERLPRRLGRSVAYRFMAPRRSQIYCYLGYFVGKSLKYGP